MKPSSVQMEEKSSCFLLLDAVLKKKNNNVAVTSKCTEKFIAYLLTVKSLLVLHTLQSHLEAGRTSKHTVSHLFLFTM